jgi:thioredoxin-related protein/cytochrome b
LKTGRSLDFNEKHSLGIRVWHWVFFLLLTASMSSVLLASTLFRTRNNTAMVRDQLQQNNLIVDQNQARAVAHAFNDRLWDLHTWIGYFIVLFLLGRFILEIFQPSDEKLSYKIKRALGPGLMATEQKSEQMHYARVKWGYILFYALIFVMAITGLGLAFEEVPLFKDLHGTIKQVHSFTQYLIYGFVFFHLAGVVIADAGRYPGLVSGMIHGKKQYLCFFLFLNLSSPPQWHVNMLEARDIARKEHRHILLNFSGSDWCGPCIMLRKEIFDDPTFSALADTTLVLVNADFPRMKKNQLSKEQQAQNDQLADQYNSQGKFPLTLLLDADGKVIKQWEGNPAVKPAEFSTQIKALIDAEKAAGL